MNLAVNFAGCINEKSRYDGIPVPLVLVQSTEEYVGI